MAQQGDRKILSGGFRRERFFTFPGGKSSKAVQADNSTALA
jgi:hypothetical protein